MGKKLNFIAWIMVIAGLALAFKNTDNIWIVGDQNPAVDKVIEMGTGRIKYNGSAGQLQFSNDSGGIFKAIGSGGGGGTGGVNVLLNPNAETETTDNWTASGGAFAVGKAGDAGFAAADIGFDIFSFSWDAPGTAETLTSDQVAVPAGLFGKSCLARLQYKGGDVSQFVRVIDGGLDTLIEANLESGSGYQIIDLPFTCPSTGTFALQLDSDGATDPDVVFLDNLSLGENFLVGRVSQAVFVGSAKFEVANCAWTNITSSFSSYPVDADCVPTLKGDVVAATTTIPGARVLNASPGNYYIEVHLTAKGALDAGNTHAYQLNVDGSNVDRLKIDHDIDPTSKSDRLVLGGQVVKLSGGDLIIEILGAASSASFDNQLIGDNNSNTTIYVWRYPSDSDIAYSPDILNWRVSANISSSANEFPTGTSNVSAYTMMDAPDATMVNNSEGTIIAEIPCTGGNPSVGSTCSSGNERNGISFNLPRAGVTKVCVSFAHRLSMDQGEQVQTTFEIHEGDNTTGTTIQDGEERITHVFDAIPLSVGSYEQTRPFKVCGLFSMPTSGKKSFYLKYEQEVLNGPSNSNFVVAVPSGAFGEPDIHWEAWPVDQHVPNPVIVDNVTTEAEGGIKIVAGEFDKGAGNCSTVQETGDWIATSAHISAGRCNITMPSGIFPTRPMCTCTLTDHSADGMCVFLDITTTTIEVLMVDGSNNPINEPFDLICVGIK